MESLRVSMDVLLSLGISPKSAWHFIRNAGDYCEKMWIEGNEVSLDRAKANRGTILTYQEAKSKGSSYGYFHVEYLLKEGVDFLPERAFRHARFKSFNLPEGIKTLKPKCFEHCTFECDLILPDSLERISPNVFDGAKVSGEFKMSKSIKYISSLPDTECIKDEIILPEGLIRFHPEHICTRHLHIPASLREFGAYRQSSVEDIIEHITIDSANKSFVLKDGSLEKAQ